MCVTFNLTSVRARQSKLFISFVRCFLKRGRLWFLYDDKCYYIESKGYIQICSEWLHSQKCFQILMNTDVVGYSSCDGYNSYDVNIICLMLLSSSSSPPPPSLLLFLLLLFMLRLLLLLLYLRNYRLTKV